MNVKISQPSPSKDHGATSSPQAGQGPSDTKEMVFLAAGLLTLVVGLGGLFIYSDDAPLPATASQRIDREPMSNEFFSSDSQPATAAPMAVSQALAEEPLTNSFTPVTGTAENQPLEETDVYFALNDWNLSEEAQEAINRRTENRPEGWTGTLRIVGHTDAQGPDAYNRALGLKRAQSVKTYLISIGIPEGDIHVDTVGEDGQVCQEDTPECFEQNRRAHVAFLPASTTEGEDLQLSMIPADTDSSAGEEPVLTTDEPEIVPSETESALLEEVQKEFVSSDPLVTVESLP